MAQNRDSDALEVLGTIRDPSCDILGEVEEARDSMSQQQNQEAFTDLLRWGSDKQHCLVCWRVSINVTEYQDMSGHDSNE